MERATRIELAFSAWEAELVLTTCSAKVLIRLQLQRIILEPGFRWAPHGHYEEIATKPRRITVITNVRRLAIVGALIVGLAAFLSIGIGPNIHSSPERPVWHPVALSHEFTVAINLTTEKVVTLVNGFTVTMNVETGQIVNVRSMPRAER